MPFLHNGELVHPCYYYRNTCIIINYYNDRDNSKRIIRQHASCFSRVRCFARKLRDNAVFLKGHFLNCSKD